VDLGLLITIEGCGDGVASSFVRARAGSSGGAGSRMGAVPESSAKGADLEVFRIYYWI
jgi:hypothetical protein